MKKRIGKISIVVLFIVVISLLVLNLLIRPIQARRITGTTEDIIGTYTGVGSGQSHNIKASLDLAHTDLDTLIGDTEDVGSILGDTTGGVFYVDSNASGTTGVSWATAVNDLEECVALLSADAGDVVLLAPGHTETLSGAKAIDLDIAGVTYIGLGKGQLMAKFSYDTNTDSIAIGAAGDGTVLKNIKFVATVTAVANAIIVEAGCTDFVIEDCMFENDTAGTDEFIDTILVSGTASDRGIIRNNFFVSDTAENAGPKASINFVDCDFLQIYGNRFYGDHGDAAIFNETTASNFVTIHDNIIHVGAIGDAKLDTTAAISLVATTTGMITNNQIAINVASPDLAIVAADCHLSGNTYSELQGTFGSVPVSDSSAMTLHSISHSITTLLDVGASMNNLFTVANGPIVVENVVIYVDTQIGSEGCLIGLNINPTAPATDTAWANDGTALECNGDAAGTVYVTAGDLTTDLTATTNGVALIGSGTSKVVVPPGAIELDVDHDGTCAGAVTVYMTYWKMHPSVIVTETDGS